MHIDRIANVPLYKQIYDEIKNNILGSKFKRGELLPSERELSILFSVDRITIRKSLEMLVNDGLVEKIAGLGTKVKEFPQNSEGFSNSKNILFVLPRSENAVDRVTEPFNASLFYRIEKECAKGDYSLIYTTLSESDNLVDILSRNSIAGIIFISKISEKFYDSALKLKIPAVVINNSCEYFTSIVIDNEKGAYEAVRHLTDLGHRRIGIIKGKDGYITSNERLSGYKKALSEAGIDWQKQVITSGDWTFDGGYNSMMEVLKNTENIPTAIFACNDITAFGAIEAIRESGLSVPKHISIIGFDDIDQCKFMHPNLTTVRADTDIMGKAACQYLFSSIESGSSLNIKVVIPANLIIRSSAIKLN